MVKSVGACSDAATVCPTSTLREMTTPSIGETMVVYERLTCAWLSERAGLLRARLRHVDPGARDAAVRLRGVHVRLRREALLVERLSRAKTRSASSRLRLRLGDALPAPR